LLPLRVAQRTFFFYAEMFFDKNRYAGSQIATEALPNVIHEAKTHMINEHSGFDIKYQENKVFNLKLAAKTVDSVLIRPGETFSFWQLVRRAEKNDRYKDGLVLHDGKLVTAPGGGLCHLSNFLFGMFLHTPLTIIERHPHAIKAFPPSGEDELVGIDATVGEGWLDLKMRNDTDIVFRVGLSFDYPYMHGEISASEPLPVHYDIVNRDKRFFKKAGRVYERVSVNRREIDPQTGEIRSESLLYTDVSEIGYPLPEGISTPESEDLS
jgi:vancomycin resistance protein VanW